MSDILIKNMKMPARCVDCRFCDEIDGTCIALNDNSTACFTGKPKWCPLIEVPSHGRLIDADAINYKDEIWKKKCIPPQAVYNAWVVCGEMPTIIEVEDEGWK